MGVRTIAAALLLAATTPAWGQGAVQAPGGFVPRHALSYGPAGGPAVAVDPTHPLPVAPSGRTVSETDRSGTIATGGTAQTLAAGNPTRTGLLIQNLSDGDLWVSSLGAAVAGPPALRIGAGQLYEAPAHGTPGSAISILGASAGQAFSAREW